MDPSAFQETASIGMPVPYRLVMNTTEMTGVYAGRIVYCHWHREWEWLLVVGGNVFIEIDGDQRLLHQGQAVFVNRDEIHRAWTKPEEHAQILAFVFDLEHLRNNQAELLTEQVIKPLMEGNLGFPRWLSDEVPWQRDVLVKMKGLCKTLSANDSDKLLSELDFLGGLYGVLRIVSSVSAWDERQVPIASRNGAIRSVLTYIEAHLDERMPVRKLAASAYVSEKHFFRLFREVTGMTPNAYIHSRRIAKAEQYLERTELPIGAVSSMVGYESASRFIQVFHAMKGKTPVQFRRTIRKQ